MSPTALMGTATVLYIAPAVYLLVASLLSHQGTLQATPLPRSTEIAIWSAGLAALLAPLSFPRLLRASPDAQRLLVSLVTSVSAAAVGIALTLVSGALLPVQILSPASSLAVLGWSWFYRSCFRASPLAQVRSRYTVVIVVIAGFSLAWAALQIALWERIIDPEVGPGPDAFMIFVEVSIGAAGLAVAYLRSNASPYARPATSVLSGALFFSIPFGMLALLYWLLRIRPVELAAPPSMHGA